MLGKLGPRLGNGREPKGNTWKTLARKRLDNDNVVEGLLALEKNRIVVESLENNRLEAWKAVGQETLRQPLSLCLSVYIYIYIRESVKQKYIYIYKQIYIYI